MMRYFGPAAVAASLSLGAGETIMATGLGAWSEYRLLWLLVLSVVVKGVFVMYLMDRYTAIMGQSVGRRLVMLLGPRGHSRDLFFVRDISLNDHRVNARTFDRSQRLARGLFVAFVVYGHSRAVRNQHLADRSSDPASATGDQRGLVGENVVSHSLSTFLKVKCKLRNANCSLQLALVFFANSSNNSKQCATTAGPHSRVNGVGSM